MKKLYNFALTRARSSIARAFSTSLLGVFSGLFTSLVLLRAIVLEVDVGDFATYAIALQLSAYLSTLQLGLDFAASREIAARLGAQDEMGANQAFWELHRFNRRLTAGAALVVVIGSMALWLWGANQSTPTKHELMAKIIFLSGMGQVIQALARPYVAALVGSRSQATVNVTQTANSLVTAALAYLLLKIGLGVYCLPVAALFTWGICYCVLRYTVTLHAPWRSKSACAPNKEALKKIFKFGGLSTIGGIAWTVESTSDIVILGLTGNSSLVAAYVVWWRIPQMLFDLCTRLAYSAFPDMAHRNSKGDEEIRALFSKVAWATLFLGSIACVGLGIWLPSFMNLWLPGMHRLTNGHMISTLMGIIVLFRVISNFIGLFSFSQNSLKRTVISSITQAVVKVGLAVVCVERFGLAGLLASSILASLIPLFLIGSELLKNCMLNMQELRSFILLICLSVALPTFIRLSADHIHLNGFAGGIILTAIVWCIVFYIIRVTSKTRLS
jgi:O-antigen/teichoic acid export membrane protein